MLTHSAMLLFIPHDFSLCLNVQRKNPKFTGSSSFSFFEMPSFYGDQSPFSDKAAEVQMGPLAPNNSPKPSWLPQKKT
jgi:hypothetical protein